MSTATRAAPPAPCALALPAGLDPLQAVVGLDGRPGLMAMVSGGGDPAARWSCVGADPVETRRWRAGDPGDPFDGLAFGPGGAADGLRLDARLGPFQGGWAGFAAYELGGAFEPTARPQPRAEDIGRPPWPDLWLGLYDTVAVFDRTGGAAWALSWGVAGRGADGAPVFDPDLARRRAADLAGRLTGGAPMAAARGTPSGGGRFAPARPRAAVEADVAEIVRRTRRGDLYQANMSARFSGALAPGDRPLDLFVRLTRAAPAPFAAWLDLGDRALVSHSPELLLACAPDGRVETRPIKGTAPRRPDDPQADARAAADLAASAKDRAENLMIVDLMRNDLSRICVPGSVRVPRLMGLESHAGAHHLVSVVEGRLQPGRTGFDALRAAFPAGSITGAPKIKAMEVIAELEGEPRGAWCGAFIRSGFDGGLTASVLIRTATCARAGDVWEVEARAGAGIVCDSDPAAEYEEMLVKSGPLRRAVCGA